MSLEDVEFKAFFSYAHRDEENSQGKVTALARHLKREYEIQSGLTLNLFLDRDDLQWGDEWDRVIDSNLGFSAFLIPIITPTYLQRTECRKEFVAFHTAAAQTNSERFILPILFSSIPEHRQDDEIFQIAQSLQWSDWAQLRLLDPSATEVAVEIHKMIKTLIARAEALSQVSLVLPPDTSGGSPEDGGDGGDETAPGLQDKIAEAEVVLPEFAESVAQIGKTVAAIGESFTSATPHLTAAKSFRDRVSIMHSLAEEIAPDIETMRNSAVNLDTFATRADPGLDALLDLIEEEGELDEESDGIVTLLKSILSAADGIGGMARAAQESRPQMAKIMVSSRDMRPQITKYLEGLDYVESASATIQVWGDRARALLAKGIGLDQEE